MSRLGAWCGRALAGIALSLAPACSAGGRAAEQPVGGRGLAPPSRERLVPVALVFEPALPVQGRLTVRHESGWSTEVDAPPAGVDLALPEGPASLLLEVGERRFERTLKAPAGTSDSVVECIWRLPQ